jgi:hypothetical protein
MIRELISGLLVNSSPRLNGFEGRLHLQSGCFPSSLCLSSTTVTAFSTPKNSAFVMPDLAVVTLLTLSSDKLVEAWFAGWGYTQQAL